ncbi:MAG TPA: branched-chain amino acid ABC transporter permease [Ktedonobacteraceae bacterium]|nr:branched-chain amino acid ABC transporter permease [Ktedonobacteraceae bacterium]
MFLSRSSNILLPASDTRKLLIKWVVALLVPVVVFTLWGGESIINAVISPATASGGVPTDTGSLVAAAIFTVVFNIVVLLLAGYLVAADSGRRGMIELWVEVIVFALVPLILVILLGLILGMALAAVAWLAYFYVRNAVRKARHYTPPPPLASLKAINAEQRSVLMSRAILGGFWFGLTFALISLVVDLAYFFSGSLPTVILIWAIIRTILLPVAGYFLGRLAGIMALRRTLPQTGNGTGGNGENGRNGSRNGLRRRQQLEVLSTTRAREEAKDLVPNDLPLRSAGAQRFFLTLLVAVMLFYPILDSFLFGPGTDGRLAGYGDAGYYVILALGLNIVVGFAGLLDLGYVAFFAIGSYAWAMVGSTQFGFLTGILVNPHIWPWFFWPMLLGAALIAAFFGVILGAPTLRLRGDYLAIVTLGFGEIVPVVFTELDKYTNGINGIVGIYSPILPGVDWSSSTPYYYLILVLIAITIFINVRLRDSRLGRAWIAIREDEVAAESSGVNLVRTKLFAFAAGAFFAGLAGAFHAAKLGSVSPDSFGFGDSVIYLAMVVIGGIGSIPGVIVGAIAVYAINVFILANLDSLASDPNNILYAVHNTIANVVPGFTFGNIRNLVFGIILVAIMIFRPEGLIPSARRRRELQHGNNEEVELGALDVPPGSAEFEAEVHVE